MIVIISLLVTAIALGSWRKSYAAGFIARPLASENQRHSKSDSSAKLCPLKSLSSSLEKLLWAMYATTTSQSLKSKLTVNLSRYTLNIR